MTAELGKAERRQIEIWRGTGEELLPEEIGQCRRDAAEGRMRQVTPRKPSGGGHSTEGSLMAQ